MVLWVYDVLLCIILCYPYIVCFPPGRLIINWEEENLNTQKD